MRASRNQTPVLSLGMLSGCVRGTSQGTCEGKVERLAGKVRQEDGHERAGAHRRLHARYGRSKVRHAVDYTARNHVDIFLNLHLSGNVSECILDSFANLSLITVRITLDIRMQSAMHIMSCCGVEARSNTKRFVCETPPCRLCVPTAQR